MWPEIEGKVFDISWIITNYVGTNVPTNIVDYPHATPNFINKNFRPQFILVAFKQSVFYNPIQFNHSYNIKLLRHN